MTTTLTAEQIRKLVEWMEDRSVDTDVDSQARTYRKQLLGDLERGLRFHAPPALGTMGQAHPGKEDT